MINFCKEDEEMRGKGGLKKGLVLGTMLVLVAMVLASVPGNQNMEGRDVSSNATIVNEGPGWTVEGDGSHFEITNSSYLNVSLTSSEDVFVFMDSIPCTVSYFISSDSADFTEITLAGLKANTKYSMYQDGVLIIEFTTDENGTYTYTQDLSEHYVEISESTTDIETIPPIPMSSFAGGSGTIGDPYQISDIYQLQDMRCDLNAHYILVNDIDASETSEWNDGAGFLPVGSDAWPIGPFKGSLDGNGYAISDLYIRYTGHGCAGLFAATWCSIIKDVALIDVDIQGGHHTAAIVGKALTGTGSSSISNSYATGSVIGTSSVGMLVGEVEGASVRNCYSEGSVSGTSNVGGLIGQTRWKGSVTNSYTTCDVMGSITVGGFVGYNIFHGGGYIWNCYSTGNVNGERYFGGFVGIHHAGSIYSSYWDIETSGTTIGCGWDTGGSGQPDGRTTMQMHYSSNYYGWDFSNVWRIINGKTYPYHRWQHLPKADAGSSRTVEVEEIFNVDGTGSYDTNGVLVSYDWDFGDGNTDVGPNPSHSYETAGEYVVALVITDNEGETDTDSIIVWAIDQPPVAVAGGPYEGYEGIAIIFDASGSSDPMGFPLYYRWDFDADGVWDTEWIDTPTTEHKYPDEFEGYYELEVTNGEFTCSDIQTVVVENVVPSVNAGVDQTVNEGYLTYFTGAFDDPGWLDTHTIDWYFGDGEHERGTLTPDHIFEDNGVYTVTLAVEDNDGGEGVDTMVVTVNNVAPTVDIEQTGSDGLVVSYSGSFTDPGSVDTHTFEWDFGDGEKCTDTMSPTHTYEAFNVYWVKLTVTDDDGGVGIGLLEIVIYQGQGTEENPYMISNVYQLQAMKYDLCAYYMLAEDIDASSTAGWNGGAGFFPVGDNTDPFMGGFDGNGHVISGLKIYRPSSVYVGLFGYARDCGIIGVGLEDISIIGNMAVGGLIGYSEKTSISDSYLTVSIDGHNYLGGMVGYAYQSEISNVYCTLKMTGSDFIGGLIGYGQHSSVTSAYTIGSVSGRYYMGGIMGRSSSYDTVPAAISNCYSTCKVDGENYIGGLVGVNSNSGIVESYSTGSIIGRYYIGGLVGLNDLGVISDSYATGSITGTSTSSQNILGGLVGYNYGYIENSFSAGAVTPIGPNSGGLIGYNARNVEGQNLYWDIETSGMVIGVGYGYTGGIYGKTTVEMQLEITFEGWDFINVWGISEQNTYPYLQWAFQELDEATESVIHVVEGFDIDDGPENSLVSKLEAAIVALENDRPSAPGQIGAFINEVEAQRGKTLTDEQADMLIAAAELILYNI